jgi:sulfite reductase (NADPH) flavoprotein alpha-component
LICNLLQNRCFRCPYVFSTDISDAFQKKIINKKYTIMLFHSQHRPAVFDKEAIDQLSKNLPKDQLLWLSGYFYGLYESKNSIITAPQPVVETPQITILYASQSGNSKKAANQTAEKIQTKGWKTNVVDMADYQNRQLKTERFLLLVVSTYGEGEPPAAAETFYNWLHSPRAPRLPELNFAILALGDTSYLHFCKTGEDFDTRLEQLGAKRLVKRADCDVDFQADAAQWMDSVIQHINNLDAFKATVQPSNTFIKQQIVEKAPTYNAKKPFQAEIIEKIQLNGRGSAKETYHLELATESLKYEAGDALSILASNSERLVAAVLKTTRLEPSTLVKFDNQELTLGEILLNHTELSVLTRKGLTDYHHFSKNEKLGQLLLDNSALQQYIYGRDIVDLLNDFPTDFTAETFVKILKKMPARAYSLASSPLFCADEAHLTVSAVRYQAFGRKKEGVCSTFLADRIGIGEKLNVYVHENEYFRLPKDSNQNIIMVGAGTGIAPFRAFAQEREVTGATGKNWLFFGNPNFTTDFLYQLEWQQYLKKGILNRLDVAFSRDQAEKIYVQHRLLQQSKQVFNWLENGAHFYVCGDKNRLAGDIERALIGIATKEGGFSTEKATEYVKNLKKQRRYLEDVY